MTQSERADASAEHEGPTINGQPTSVSVFSTDQLRQSIFLASMLKTINLAYAKSETSKPELRMHTGDRLGSTEELLANLIHPESFVIIVSQPGTSEVIATASCRRYLGPPEDSTSPWVRRLPVKENCIEWELKMMATHPNAERQGLAGFMMKLAEQEILRRARLTQSDFSSPKDVILVLCTPTEINGPFYARRGYQQDYENERGEGFNFHIVFLSKTIGRLD